MILMFRFVFQQKVAMTYLFLLLYSFARQCLSLVSCANLMRLTFHSKNQLVYSHRTLSATPQSEEPWRQLLMLSETPLALWIKIAFLDQTVLTKSTVAARGSKRQ